MSATTAARLAHALEGTRIAPAIAAEHADLLARRDALLALEGARA
jgi:beta-N-acetylhexosaminidase